MPRIQYLSPPELRWVAEMFPTDTKEDVKRKRDADLLSGESGIERRSVADIETGAKARMKQQARAFPNARSPVATAASILPSGRVPKTVPANGLKRNGRIQAALRKQMERYRVKK